MAMAVAWRATEGKDDHVRLLLPDHPHDIRQRAVVSPIRHSFFDRGGETEIDGAGEILCAAVIPSGGQEFLRAEDAKQRSLFQTQQVLAALAAGDGKITGAQFETSRKIRHHGVVFVVRVRADHQNAAQYVQLRQ